MITHKDDDAAAPFNNTFSIEYNVDSVPTCVALPS